MQWIKRNNKNEQKQRKDEEEGGVEGAGAELMATLQGARTTKKKH